MRRHAVVLSLWWLCSAPQPVRPGIDVLLSDSLHLVRGVKVGIITNQTGIDREGRDDITRLRAAGVEVTAILSPEHGFRGALDVENIGHGVDSATGIPVFSLYGDVRAPTADMVRGVDALVVDLQDVGARPYTYISTVLLALQWAAGGNLPVIVLDRPNPIGGALVQGPVLDTTLASFIGMLPVPLRHGMTIGELARLGRDALDIPARLVLVPVSGWERDRWFDQTGLPWVRPSPSMPSLESAAHYPGTVLFEATNLSVGRGTPLAFQVIGAPWLDAARIARDLAALPGVALSDTTVVPENSPDRKYDGIRLPAVRLRVTDRARYDPTRTAVHLLAAVRRLHPDSLHIDTLRLDRRAGDRAIRLGLERGTPPDSIVAGWQPALDRFKQMRARYLLY
ncbi:MAG TPA: DUF1343 domain-containing protein [Gemmatimonadales bacterium]|nr:DUF1343 domain-containing protein [Gemmatimonadales bacterium]